MTDRFKGLVVTFEHPVREDDAEALIQAIKMLKGVIGVAPVLENVDDQINRTQIRDELGQKLIDLVWRG